MDAMGGLTHERVQTKSRIDALGALWEVLPFEVSGILGSAAAGTPVITPGLEKKGTPSMY